IAHGDAGIRVSCLCPMGVKTDMLAAEREQLGTDFLTATALEPEVVAQAVVEGIAVERFLILPHPEVGEFFRREADDYDRWLRGLRRMRAGLLASARWVRWLALAAGIALVVLAAGAVTRVADTREGLIAEIVTLFAGGAGVVLLIYGLAARPRPA